MRGILLAGAAVAAVALLLVLDSNGESRRAPKAELPIPTGLLEDELNTIEVFRQVSPSVVFITNSQLRRSLFSLDVMEVPRGSGSGFLWDDQGHVVTNYHVVQGGDSFSVALSDGSVQSATAVGGEAAKDLAVLKIEVPAGGLRAIPLGSSRDLVVGQKVLAVGNPFGLDQTLTTGVISALGREIPSVISTTIRNVIQTDASINPGNSGGPLLDSHGRLIGVNTSITSTSGSSAGIGFAVPVDTVKRIVPQLIRFGAVQRAGLGVTVLPDHIARRLGVTGVVVHEVRSDGPAARAGIESLRADLFGNLTGFDLLLALDGQELHSYDDLFTALEAHEAGDEIELQVARGREVRSVRVKLENLNER